VLYIPSAREYVHDGEWVKPSSHFKGFFDTVRRPSLSQTDRHGKKGLS
jgi:hypothetical protein